MTLLRQTIELPLAPAAVYDYVTRPLRWKEWHPSSLAVREVGDESLVAGRRFEEDVRAAGRQRQLQWMVEESRPGSRWRASAYMADGSTVRLTYELDAAGSGTRLTRTLEYTLAPRLLRWFNDLFLWRRMEGESAAALEGLRQRLTGRAG
jgi:hypothetical protein